MRSILSGVCAAGICVAVGCAPPRSAAAPRPAAAAPATPAAGRPATQPTSRPNAVYANPKFDIKLVEPAGYVARPSADYELLLVPVGSPASPAVPTDSLSMDVPDLPVHLPGLIPLGLVVHGYISDLKQAHPGLIIEQNQNYSIPDAKAWIVQSHWPDGKTTDMETAILVVHDDHVFILRAGADAAGRAKTLRDYDQFVRSLRWAK
jgi:hypothetical protein